MTETSTNDPELLQTDSGSEECSRVSVRSKLTYSRKLFKRTPCNLYERIRNRDALILTLMSILLKLNSNCSNYLELL